MGPPDYLNFTIHLLFQIPNVLYMCPTESTRYDALFSFSNTAIRSNGGIKGNNFPGFLTCLHAPRTVKVWEPPNQTAEC